jgi:hypothetical protein
MVLVGTILDLFEILKQRAVDQPKSVVTEKVSFAHSFVISDIGSNLAACDDGSHIRI